LDDQKGNRRYNSLAKRTGAKEEKQAKRYSAEEKAKIVIEAIKGELTIAQIIQ